MMRPLIKPCFLCGSPISRCEQTDKQWDFTRLCPPCEREDLRSRLKAAIRIDEATGCWLWLRSTRNGYGQISVHDHPAYAHRLSYELFVAPLPAGHEALHRCDVQRCINPDHLFPGTQLDNILDMREKGRETNPPLINGMAHHKATLTAEQIQEVRRLRAAGVKQRDVARQFGVAQSTVWRFAHHIGRQDANT